MFNVPTRFCYRYAQLKAKGIISSLKAYGQRQYIVQEEAKQKHEINEMI
jgi:hypothetical protein